MLSLLTSIPFCSQSFGILSPSISFILDVQPIETSTTLSKSVRFWALEVSTLASVLLLVREYAKYRRQNCKCHYNK